MNLNFMIIKLNKDQETIIDDERWESINTGGWKIWEISPNGYCVGRRTYYAGRRINKKGMSRSKYKRTGFCFLHRLLMGVTDARTQIDHIDGNKLNNQLSNLRIATQSQNNMNNRKRSSRCASIYKGVSRNNRANRWQARIQADYRQIHLGYFKSEIEAAASYNIAAIEKFGGRARLNIIT